MRTIPTITKQDIRTFAGDQKLLKGQQHVRDGAIVNPEQQAMALKAYCYGSFPEPYRVKVTFDGSGIASAPVQQAHRHMELADANMLLHCSSHGRCSRRPSPKWMTSIPSWIVRAKPS